MASERVRVGIYDLTTGSTTWLQTGEPRDQYLTNLTWSPDENSIYIVHLNRDQNHVRVVTYDPVSGDPLLTLFEEKDPRYIILESGPRFIDNHSDRFLWFSRKDGHRHLYLYDSDGKMVKKLTRGEWDITAMVTAEKSGENVFITTTAKSPLERHAYRLNVSSGRLYPLTGQRGDHHIHVNDSGEYILDTFSSVSVPAQTEILDDHGRSVKKVLKAENPLKDFSLGEIKIDSLNTAEGTRLYSRMFLPPDFHDGAKYPVIVYVYNGPHIQLIRNSWLAGGRLWFHYMAQKGYIVYTVDGRGSAFRGAEFEKVIFRKLGTVEIEDQLKGIEYLKSLAFVDTTRIGVFGWSYGGYMSASLMTRVPGVFKVGVAGAPVIDWRYYEVMYTERFMDTPESNPDGYIKSSVLEYIDQLDGRLLLIHGTSDPVVVWQHTLLFLDRAVDEEKQVDYFVYPGHEHHVTGNDAYHLYRKITDYFDLHL